MIITKNKDYLYNIKNFNSYNNVYAILVNHNIIENISEAKANYDDNLYISYTEGISELNCFFLIDESIKVRKPYKIVYGHFYNKYNIFLYKTIINGKVFDLNIKHCKYEDLLFNENKNLICSKKYSVLDREARLFNDEWEIKYKESIIKPISLNYIYETETLEINLKNGGLTDISFENECLTIISNKITTK